MSWVVRHGRLALTVTTAALAILVALAGLPILNPAPPLRKPGPAYPRIQQAAGIVDLLRRLDPALRPAALRALDGVNLAVSIERRAPVEGADLIRAPRIEEKLREFAAPGLGDDLRAYVDARFSLRTTDTEGWPARVVWPIAEDQVLVLTSTDQRARRSTVSMMPRPVMIGLAGVAVAGLALLIARRESAALDRLTQVTRRFDGGAAAAIDDSGGGPEIRRLAVAVSDMQNRVALLLQERSFLIGAISHDLKTYLTRLRLRAETLADAEQRDRMAGDLEAMSDLIDTSLAFARGTTLAQHMSLVDLADLVAIEAAERTALGQPVAADVEGNALVLGDPVALRRVLGNLVDNALKFGRGRIELAVETDGTSCRILVDDNGPGIGAVERVAVFSPFYRIEGSRNRHTGGSGLGLAIARQIVEAHGGTVTAEIGPLGGARIAVNLPLASTVRA